MLCEGPGAHSRAVRNGRNVSKELQRKITRGSQSSYRREWNENISFSGVNEMSFSQLVAIWGPSRYSKGVINDYQLNQGPTTSLRSGGGHNKEIKYRATVNKRLRNSDLT